MGSPPSAFVEIAVQKETSLKKPSRKNRPTAKAAVLEILLVLAVGTACVGVFRGWFRHSSDHQIELKSDGNVEPMGWSAAVKVDRDVEKWSGDLH